ncbi:MAG: hypothetical protein WDM78_09390 [Puia sp.]
MVKTFQYILSENPSSFPCRRGDVTLDPVELDNNIYFVRADAGSPKSSGQGLGGLLDRLFEPEASGTPFTQHIVLESKTGHGARETLAGKTANRQILMAPLGNIRLWHH